MNASREPRVRAAKQAVAVVLKHRRNLKKHGVRVSDRGTLKYTEDVPRMHWMRQICTAKMLHVGPKYELQARALSVTIACDSVHVRSSAWRSALATSDPVSVSGYLSRTAGFSNSPFQHLDPAPCITL